METIKNVWKDRYTYAQYMAIVASVLNGMGLLLMDTDGTAWGMIGALALLLGIGLTFCSYCLGGFWTAVKAALNIAKWGWLVVPFPYDLVTGLAAFVFAMIALFLFPEIPVTVVNLLIAVSTAVMALTFFLYSRCHILALLKPNKKAA